MLTCYETERARRNAEPEHVTEGGRRVWKGGKKEYWNFPMSREKVANGMPPDKRDGMID